MKTEKIIDIKINRITTKEVLEEIKSFLLSENQHYIVTLNPEMVIEAQNNTKFKEVINKTDLIIPDGIGILWALEFLKEKRLLFSKSKNIIINNILIKSLSLISILFNFIYTFLKLLFSSKHRKNILRHRTHGIDLIYKICESNSIKNKKIFLLGAGEGVAKKVAVNLKKKYPDVDIVGAEEGMKENQESGIRNQDLIQRINEANPNILLVAFGAPKQEVWIHDNLENIPSVKLAIGIGGSFDFISGKIKRAPIVFQKTGLEWLWRLTLEPKRIKRIYNAIIKFPFFILNYKIKNFDH
ncbi:MAG: WecB/TagA/CpsF family glycosyltransferase [Candidatus Pacebacteria bacterium]|nr:WecB/TagA/CpsF family glycosyltransferase [Candidatus Paceibacterota bacterium]